MTKQEQVAEMAVVGCVRNPQAHTVEECSKCDFKQGQCNAYRHAEALYNAGYRTEATLTCDFIKMAQKHAVQEFVDELRNKCSEVKGYHYSFGNILGVIDELLEDYKMNNYDIKKALSTCAEISCEGCPYTEHTTACGYSCSDKLKLDACDLITKQEKEIETSKTALTQATNMYSRMIELLNTYDVNDVIALMEKLENDERRD